jgi:hypothetical protein
MISATIEVIYRSYSLFFLYANLCASLSPDVVGNCLYAIMFSKN